VLAEACEQENSAESEVSGHDDTELVRRAFSRLIKPSSMRHVINGPFWNVTIGKWTLTCTVVSLV
jgi:hypothetical protein